MKTTFNNNEEYEVYFFMNIQSADKFYDSISKILKSERVNDCVIKVYSHLV